MLRANIAGRNTADHTLITVILRIRNYANPMFVQKIAIVLIPDIVYPVYANPRAMAIHVQTPNIRSVLRHTLTIIATAPPLHAETGINVARPELPVLQILRLPVHVKRLLPKRVQAMLTVLRKKNASTDIAFLKNSSFYIKQPPETRGAVVLYTAEKTENNFLHITGRAFMRPVAFYRAGVWLRVFPFVRTSEGKRQEM